MNQENLVASRGVPRLNVVRDLVGEGPHSPTEWIPGLLPTTHCAISLSGVRMPGSPWKDRACRQKLSLVRVELLDCAARSEKFAHRSTLYVEAHDEVILPNCRRGFAGMRPAKQV